MLLTDDYERERISNKEYPQFSEEFTDLMKTLDRGRTDNHTRLYSANEWKKMIEDAGFTIVKANTHLSPLAIKAHDIGLRPIFPLLNKFMNKLSHTEQLTLKGEWIDIFAELLYPLLVNDTTDKGGYLCVQAVKNI